MPLSTSAHESFAPINDSFSFMAHAAALPFKLVRIVPETDLDFLANERKLEGYEILYIAMGSGLITINLKTYTICDHQLFFLGPDQIRQVRTTQPLNGFYLSVPSYYLKYTGDDLDFSLTLTLLLKGSAPLVAKGIDAPMEQIAHVLSMMDKECNDDSLLRLDIVKELLRIFLLLLCKKMDNKLYSFSNRSHRELVEKFIRLLAKEFIITKSVNHYANQLCVTSRCLNLAVKNVVGVSVSRYIQNFIIAEAKRQVIKSNRSMKEIAFALGFEDRSHFSKFFKKGCGMTFSTYKRQRDTER